MPLHFHFFYILEVERNFYLQEWNGVGVHPSHSILFTDEEEMGDKKSYQRPYNKLWKESGFHSPSLLSRVLLGITSCFLQKSEFIKETLNIIAEDIWSRIYATRC